MGRSPCCGESGELKKGPWTPKEDQILSDFVQKHGHGSWRALPKLAGLNRCGKSCRLRWINYLRPDIKRGKFSEEEENLIVELHSALGNKWSRIATHLPGRTDNEIKNFWNTHLRKKLLKTGIDPKTHEPIPNLSFLINNISQLIASPSNYPLYVPTITSYPWIDHNGLKFPSAAGISQLTNINNQLLQSILQIINTSPLPNFGNASTFLPSQCATNPSEEWLRALNKEDTLGQRFECDATGPSSMGSSEAFNMTGLKSSGDGFFNDCQLPALVSSSVGESTDNQMNIKDLAESDAVEADWDSEDYSFLWKDIALE